VQDKAAEHPTVYLAKQQSALFKDDGEKGDDEEPMVPNLVHIASRFEEGGVGVGKTEAFRLVLPSLYSLLIAATIIEGFVAIWNETSFRVALVCCPLLYLVGSVVGAVIIKFTKALLVGKYEPTVSPLWSPFVWKAETYSAVLHDFGVPLFINSLLGTPFLPWLMRFLGAKVGKRTFINTSDWTETDLFHIGDDSAINANAPLQAHLFEDRVMKVGSIKVGERCSVGHYSVILCDSELKNDAHIGDMSLVMKGETIPSHTFWTGSPVQVGADPVKAYEKLKALKSNSGSE
jgi:non-ribosomal peptide synthetase-like protein